MPRYKCPKGAKNVLPVNASKTHRVNRGALVSNISKVKPNNIMYLRRSGAFDKITQIKQIE